MGIRAPVVIVSKKEQVKKLKDYCEATQKDGANDATCYFCHVKKNDNKFYVCISTYGVGLSKLRSRFPKYIVTNTKSITTGFSYFVNQGEYDNYNGKLIPEFEQLVNYKYEDLS